MATLLVTVGDSRSVEPTLRWGAGFASRAGLHLVVAHSMEEVDYETDRGQWSELTEVRREELRRLVNSVTEQPCDVEILHDEPHSALIRRSAQDDVAYVVVGRHRRGGVGGFGGAGTAFELIRHNDKPTIVVSGEDTEITGPVLVGIDGSHANRAAVAAAEDLAGRLGTGLIGVFCTDPMADTFPHPDGWTYPHESEVRAELAPLLAPHAELLIEHGQTTETILAVARARAAQLVVVGTRGRGGFGGLRAGRVPLQLADHASVPVVVVPHSA